MPRDESERIRSELAALEAEAPLRRTLRFSCDPTVLAEHSMGSARPSQVLSAVRSPHTRYAEYEATKEQYSRRLGIGVQHVRGKRADFLLVLLAFGGEAPEREIVSALRLTPEGDDFARCASDPAQALGSLIATYGHEYEIEAGQRTLFTPVIEFERGRFVHHDRVQLDEISEALGIPDTEDSVMLIAAIRVKPSGGALVFFPIMIRADDYQRRRNH